MTGADNLRSIDTPEDCREVIKALEIWLKDWQSARILERFDELVRENGTWKIAHRKMVNDWSRTQPVADGWLQRHAGAHRGRRSIDDSRLPVEGSPHGA